MRELKDDLASLRIDREAPRPGRWRWLIWLVVVVLVAAGSYYFVKARPALGEFGATEVEAVQPTIQSSSGPNAGTPILTASGYLVARKQSVVSSKIQGRISSLRVEEGSVVNAGDILATLDNEDAQAAIVKANADIEYAKADLAEAQRQEKLQEDLYRSKVVSQDALGCRQSQGKPGGSGYPAGQSHTRRPAGLSRLHHSARAVCRRRGQEDDRGRRKRRSHSAWREHLHFLGSDCRHRRHEFAGSGSRRERIERRPVASRTSQPKSRCRRFPATPTRAFCGR